MKVLFATSESYPFASSGGLGDVASALPKALRKRLVGARVVMPLYSGIPQSLRENMKFMGAVTVPVAWRRQYCGIFETKIDGVIYYLLDNEYYFRRQSMYGDYDDGERFAFFSRAVLEILPELGFFPDIIHCNDWQTAMTPVFLKLMYAKDPRYSGIKTVFTIHNIQYQGKFGKEFLGDVLGVPEECSDVLEYGDCVNLMKGALECADRVTTVSPRYARELSDPWFAYGLESEVARISDKLTGIVNGIDTEVYNPETDRSIPFNYSADDLSGKEKCKAALQTELGLPVDAGTPLIVMVSRLTEQKGIDLVRRVADSILQNNVQFAVLGSGDREYEQFFGELAGRYPGEFAFRRGFIPDLARRFYAGADMFLMPSKTEPCGLAQMIALRYGTVPIVRETGGLADTVEDSGSGGGNGFTFPTYNAHDMDHAVWRALEGYKDKEGWATLSRRAMECDNSWGKSANAYIRLYKSLVYGGR